jgi:hypothetical protein
MFLIFNFDLEYLRRVQSSEPLHTKMHLILLLVGIRGCLDSFSYWLSHFYLLKKSAKKVLLYFGLDCGLLVSGSAEKIAVCAHTTRDPNK